MPERMQFLLKADVLSFEELVRLVDGFIHRGITKLRITGGEPLVRRDVLLLLEHLSRRLQTTGLKEVSLTTNGTRLEHFAVDLKTQHSEHNNTLIPINISESYEIIVHSI